MKKILILASIILSSNLFAQQTQEELAETILNIFKENDLSRLSEYVITLKDAKDYLIQQNSDTSKDKIRKYLNKQETIVKNELLKFDSIYNGFYTKKNKLNSDRKSGHNVFWAEINWMKIKIKSIRTVAHLIDENTSKNGEITSVNFKYKRRKYNLLFDSYLINNKLKVGYYIALNG